MTWAGLVLAFVVGAVVGAVAVYYWRDRELVAATEQMLAVCRELQDGADRTDGDEP